MMGCFLVLGVPSFYPSFLGVCTFCTMVRNNYLQILILVQMEATVKTIVKKIIQPIRTRAFHMFIHFLPVNVQVYVETDQGIH